MATPAAGTASGRPPEAPLRASLPATEVVVTPQAVAEPRRATDVFASEAAFDAWYGRALPRVYGYVYSRCGHDPDLAEELTQRAFIDAVRGRAGFDGRSDPITWVCAIARHKLADHFREREAEERRHLRLVERQRDIDATPDPDGVDEREAVVRALDALPIAQRAVLVFTVLDGLTVREAAVLLGRSESATESLLGRARASFRSAYADEGGELDG